jgi:phosphopantothenoylcysteine decarboxylase/phosphopantothenate--cysteine ligase
VQRNVRQLAADGVVIVEPTVGWLACRQQGTGRMAEPEQITVEITRALAGSRR